LFTREALSSFKALIIVSFYRCWSFQSDDKIIKNITLSEQFKNQISKS